MENITNLTNKDYSSYVTQAQTSNLTNQIKKSTSSEATDEEMLAAGIQLALLGKRHKGKQYGIAGIPRYAERVPPRGNAG